MAGCCWNCWSFLFQPTSSVVAPVMMKATPEEPVAAVVSEVVEAPLDPQRIEQVKAGLDRLWQDILDGGLDWIDVDAELVESSSWCETDTDAL